LICFFSKGKMCLCNIAEGNHKYSSNYFSGRRIPAQMVNKKFQENIIQRNATNYYNEITKQLCMPFQIRFAENYIPA